MKNILFVPATEKMLSKVGVLNCDAYIIDLEDSIPDCEKQNALSLLIEWLKDKRLENIFVRLNSNNFRNEAKSLDSFNVGFMLPKFQDTAFYNDCLEIWQHHKVLALIETPLGVINAFEIASCKWIDMIAFGAEDYTAQLNMNNSNELLTYPKLAIVNAAKSQGKRVFDTPSFNYADLNALSRDVQNSADLGFDGKLAINPKQIEIINSIFSSYDFAFMKEVIDEYEKSGLAVFQYKGKIYEKMHIARMKRILKENQ